MLKFTPVHHLGGWMQLRDQEYEHGHPEELADAHAYSASGFRLLRVLLKRVYRQSICGRAYAAPPGR